MKLALRFLFLTSFIVFSLVTVFAQDPCTQGQPYRNCKACGTAASVNGKQLNVLKNRDTKATAPQKITVAQIQPGTAKTFSSNQQVWVTGYVASVVAGGNMEACNCNRTDLRDVHINIVSDPSQVNDQSQYVVVEFTPRWEKTFGFDDSNYEAMRKKVENQIKNKWVKFEGWMMYDTFHVNASKSTMPNQKTCPNDGQQHPKCNWRATPWEVHPVTAYTVVTKP
jgi:hypothetical protein